MFGFFSAVALLIQSTAATSGSAGNAAGVTDTAVLWRDLRVGMNAEQVAEILRLTEGISAVRLSTKPNKPPKFDIDYAGDGVQIGNLSVTVTPVFEGNALQSVILANDVCSSVAVVNAKIIAETLKSKYGSVQRMTIVDDAGVKIDEQFAFFNVETRVALSFKSRNDANYDRVYASGKLGGSLAKLANSMNETAANNAIAACPADRGERTRTFLTYTSQTAFIAEHAKEEIERSAKAGAMKDGL